MAKKPNPDQVEGLRANEPLPPGATKKAFERPETPRTGPSESQRDIHAAGTPAGGSEVGGLGGTNIGDGAPENADLERTMADTLPDDTETADPNAPGPAYGGRSGGAVGGAIAQGRSKGGTTHGGLRPGGDQRGDSTIGTDPNADES